PSFASCVSRPLVAVAIPPFLTGPRNSDETTHTFSGLLPRLSGVISARLRRLMTPSPTEIGRTAHRSSARTPLLTNHRGPPSRRRATACISLAALRERRSPTAMSLHRARYVPTATDASCRVTTAPDGTGSDLRALWALRLYKRTCRFCSDPKTGTPARRSLCWPRWHVVRSL